MIEVEDFLKYCVRLINHVDGTRHLPGWAGEYVEGKHRIEFALGVDLYTNHKTNKDNTVTISLGGNGWMMALTCRRSAPKEGARVCLKQNFEYHRRDFYIINYTLLSPEKFEDDLTLIKVAF